MLLAELLLTVLTPPFSCTFAGVNLWDFGTWHASPATIPASAFEIVIQHKSIHAADVRQMSAGHNFSRLVTEFNFR